MLVASGYGEFHVGGGAATEHLFDLPLTTFPVIVALTLVMKPPPVYLPPNSSPNLRYEAP